MSTGEGRLARVTAWGWTERASSRSPNCSRTICPAEHQVHPLPSANDKSAADPGDCNATAIVATRFPISAPHSGFGKVVPIEDDGAGRSHTLFLYVIHK